jgi:hypothetical protein
MDQGPRIKGPFYEYELYPPTQVIDMDKYSDELGITYWDAKVEVWETYAPSLHPLQEFLDSELFKTNDRHEYFVRHK